MSATNREMIDARQQTIVPIGAFASAGNMANLNTALNAGLDAVLTVNEVREILVQPYAYGEPLKPERVWWTDEVHEVPKHKGMEDAPGREPIHHGLQPDGWRLRKSWSLPGRPAKTSLSDC